MTKRLLATLSDTTLFLQEWLVNPQRTGSVVPSSRQLAAAMARWLPRNPESFVLELGPGTGAVTAALLKRGLREDRLVAIEHNPNARQAAPQAVSAGANHHRRRVAHGRRCSRELREPVESVGAVISSLPLLNFPKKQVEALAQKIRDRARTAGQLGAIQLPD